MTDKEAILAEVHALDKILNDVWERYHKLKMVVMESKNLEDHNKLVIKEVLTESGSIAYLISMYIVEIRRSV